MFARYYLVRNLIFTASSSLLIKLINFLGVSIILGGVQLVSGYVSVGLPGAAS